MAVSYSKLWKVLVDKNMSKADLRKKAEISSNTMTRMRKNEPVTLDLLSRICKELNVDFGDIVSYVPDNDNKTKDKNYFNYFYLYDAFNTYNCFLC